MNRIERSIYFDMRTLYMKTGDRFTEDLDLLQRRLSCQSDEEKEALSFLLKDKFVFDKRSKSYKQSEWDAILKNYRWAGRHINDDVTEYVTTDVTEDVTNKVTLTAAERKAKSRQEAKELRDDLALIGVETHMIKGVRELKALYSKHEESIQLFKSKSNVTNSKNDVTENVTENDAITNNQEPITDNHKPVTNTVGDRDWIDEKFEEFYSLYPNKKGRGQAESTWSNVFLGKSDGKYRHRKPENPEALFAQIMEAVKLQTPSIQSAEPRYRKHPSTWLNAKAWADEVDTSQPTNSQQKPDRLAVNAQWGQVAMTDEEIAEYRSTMMPIDEYEAMQSSAAPVTEEEF